MLTGVGVCPHVGACRLHVVACRHMLLQECPGGGSQSANRTILSIQQHSAPPQSIQEVMPLRLLKGFPHSLEVFF